MVDCGLTHVALPVSHLLLRQINLSSCFSNCWDTCACLKKPSQISKSQLCKVGEFRRQEQYGFTNTLGHKVWMR
jgi:hypothetical protein